MLQAGVTANYPAEAYDVTTESDKITVLAPTRPIKHRGDTLTGPVLTVTLSSPAEGVIRVRLEHYVGGLDNRPKVPLQQDKAPGVKVEQKEGEVVLTSGSASAHLKTKDGWELTFKSNGKVLTKSAWRGMGYIQHAKEGNFMHDQLTLSVGECVYGLGERFTGFVKNGQIVEIWNKDGGTSCEQAYKNVPFYLTNRGYGVLVNETGPINFEVASEKVNRVQFSLPGESLEYFVIAGPTPKEVISRLTALTGRPALPPSWSFGLWLSTSFTTSYDEKTVTSFIQGMADRKLPLSVFHFDCFWMKEFEWCNFKWDERQFPDPAGMLARLKARGLRICVWINPYIAQKSPLFAEGVKGGYLLKRADGSTWQTDQWQPGMGIVDFTNPAACKWFQGHLRRLMDMGVDCFKTDFGERIPTDVVYFDGSDPVGMHNHYTNLYNQCVFELLEGVRGKGEAVLFARSAYTSGQRFPLHWGGDCWSTFESMAESLRGGLSLAMCGFGYWSHDIGGFEGNPPPDVYKRWLAWGLLCSHSRLHGSYTYRVPWLVDEESNDVLRFFTKLKCSMMPYLFNQAVVAHKDGIPMLRAMMVEFAGDPACDTLDLQYMLGDSLLVAPVMRADNSADYYLPAGKWTHLLTGEVVEGGRWVRSTHDFLSAAVYVRENTILPIGPVQERPDYDYEKQVCLRIYQLADKAKAVRTVNTQKGDVAFTATATREGKVIEVQVAGGAKSAWSVQLVGISNVAAVAGATLEQAKEGVIITPACGSEKITLTIAD